VDGGKGVELPLVIATLDGGRARLETASGTYSDQYAGGVSGAAGHGSGIRYRLRVVVVREKA
jgi:hypothetical protein